MTMRERIEAGKLFTDMCEGLPEDRLKGKKLMKAYNDSNPGDMQERMRLINEIFGKETNAWIEPSCYFCYGTNITLGEGTYINFDCNFVDDGKINIGKDVLFGPSVTIATTGHPVNPKMREYMYADTVTIEDNCWIGAGAIICPGVTIGRNSVIGAGSVVTHDIPEDSVAAGSPCRVIRPIGEQDEKYYYKDREISQADLEQEAALRK